MPVRPIKNPPMPPDVAKWSGTFREAKQSPPKETLERLERCPGTTNWRPPGTPGKK